jgi:ribosomal protein L16 Arg81 hydroxylase
MINYDLEYIEENFLKSKKESVPFFIEKCFSDEVLPKWKEVIQVVYNSSVEEKDEALFLSGNSQEEEVLINNLLIIDKTYFAPQRRDLYKDFPILFEDIMSISRKIQRGSDWGIGFAGPKFSVGPRLVAAHRDPWDAFTVQCEGTTEWIISNDHGYKKSFFMNRGDLLYFPKECYHSINVTQPRAGLIFNFDPDWYQK